MYFVLYCKEPMMNSCNQRKMARDQGTLSPTLSCNLLCLSELSFFNR